jgi:hypothetical protein
MMANLSKYFILVLALAALVLFAGQTGVHAGGSATISSTVYITAVVTQTSSGGGGGGTTGTLPTVVNFSGMAYPGSKVVILQDGVIALTVYADSQANFSASISNLTQGSYNFSLYTEDQNGLHSVSFSFPVFVTTGTTVNIQDIVLAPTINVDKLQVKRGDTETIFGFAVPNSQVTISVHSAIEQVVSTLASKTGVYLYNLNTSPLEYGAHTAKAHSVLGNKISAETNPVSFTVSTETKNNSGGGCGTLIGDLNCDGKVNLVDFSIMAYWYKKGTTPPPIVDLNHDGKITLVDFSILAYHWTG